MSRHSDDLPESVRLLPYTAAARVLTRGVLTGQEEPPLVALLRSSRAVGTVGSRWDARAVRELVEDSMRLHREEQRTQADAWLGPRLHAALRLTRREAADPELWNFLALVVAPDYVLWRHLPGRKEAAGTLPAVAVDRFTGPHHKQVFARLWWATELFRDGEDYSSAVTACGNQDILHTMLRLDIIDHRPMARAVIRLMERGVLETGREVNALAKAINSAGSTLMYDLLAPDEGADADALRAWIAESEVAPPVPREGLPVGPDDGPVPQESVDSMVKLLEKLFEKAPVRGRNPRETSQSLF